jgi:rare lipoprotein A
VIRKFLRSKLAFTLSALTAMSACVRFASAHDVDRTHKAAAHTSKTLPARRGSKSGGHDASRTGLSKRHAMQLSGVASWYGRGFNGRHTATGERFNMYAMTAAHRTLPLGSYVRVTSLRNGRSVVVRINDRGPFNRRRIIDLSYAAASALGMQRSGTSRVQIEQVHPTIIAKTNFRNDG